MFKRLCLLAPLLLLVSLPAWAQLDTAQLGGLSYRSIGPYRGGRVTAVSGVRQQLCTFYMGATGGGVWKTEDCGHSWRNISDGFFATGSIGAIAVSDSNPDIVYVGTGSAAIRSNVIQGRGVYKSIDAGKTWTFIGLPNVGQIGSMRVHPQNPDVAYVAALGRPFGPNPDRGVFRTRDGGKTWQKVLFVNDRTGAVYENRGRSSAAARHRRPASIKPLTAATPGRISPPASRPASSARWTWTCPARTRGAST